MTINTIENVVLGYHGNRTVDIKIKLGTNETIVINVVTNDLAKLYGKSDFVIDGECSEGHYATITSTQGGNYVSTHKNDYELWDVDNILRKALISAINTCHSMAA